MIRRFLKLLFSSPSPPEPPVKMVEHKVRYLKNELPDYDSRVKVIIPEKSIKEQILTYVDDIKRNVEITKANGRNGLYLGSAGIAYMFFHLSRIPALSSIRKDCLQSAVDYLQPALEICKEEGNSSDIPALLLGNCGVYAVAAVVYNEIGQEAEGLKYRKLYNDACKICQDTYFLEAGSDEFFVGRAGYIRGALWMSEKTGKPFKTEDIFDLCRVVVASGRAYAHQMKSPTPLMYAYYNVEYLGAGHGVSNILQQLMSVPGYFRANPEDERDVMQAVNYLLSLQSQDGNFPAAMNEVNVKSHKLVHWCHGGSGIVYMLARAYLIWKDEKYLEACLRVGDLIWEKGLLKKGPGLCHGVAGNGYVFLLLYRLTMNNLHLHRALQFALFLDNPRFVTKARVPDHPFSLYEGMAGTVCFLADLLDAEHASFPFSEIF